MKGGDSTVAERSRASASPGVTAAKVAGVTSVGVLSLLLNPFFIGSLVAVAALVGTSSGGQQRSRAAEGRAVQEE